MALSLENIAKSTALSSPPRILIYGTKGVGKTTFCADAPAPIFLFTEDGAGSLTLDTFHDDDGKPIIFASYDQVIEAIGVLYQGEHSFETLVLDSLDHLEPLIWGKVVADMRQRSPGISTIEDIPYGKGYTLALAYWRELIAGLNALRNDRDMAIILTAHEQIRRFESPETDSFDRYSIKLHEKASAVVQELVDVILFAKHKTMLKSEDLGFNQSRLRGVSTGERIICTSETPGYVAKNRYKLPAEISLPEQGPFQPFAAALAASRQQPQT